MTQSEVTPAPAISVSVEAIQELAHALRRRMLVMASDKGEGYIAQGLGIADVLAVIYGREVRLDPGNPDAEDRDRFLLSTGHYSIALYAVLAELGVISEADIETYGLNGSDLPMSTFDQTPGVEMTGGSLGQGLGQGVGMALGLRLDGSTSQVVVELSDGELQEGSTWEAAMAAGSFGLSNLVAVVDCNGIQADGPMVLDIESVRAKWEAFGWASEEVDGNDVLALFDAFDRLRAVEDRPRVVIARTTPGYGVPTLVRRERAHFVRVGPDEWSTLREELEENHGCRG